MVRFNEKRVIISNRDKIRLKGISTVFGTHLPPGGHDRARIIPNDYPKISSLLTYLKLLSNGVFILCINRGLIDDYHADTVNTRSPPETIHLKRSVAKLYLVSVLLTYNLCALEALTDQARTIMKRERFKICRCNLHVVPKRS